MTNKWLVIKEVGTPEKAHVQYHAAYTDHNDSTTCWCHPYLEYRCPWNSNEVWIHNRCEA